MFIAAIKSFCKNSKYVFVAMGVVYLAIILAVFMLIESCVQVLRSVPPETLYAIKDYARRTLDGVTIAQFFQIEFYRNFFSNIARILEEDVERAKLSISIVANLAIAFVMTAGLLAQFLCRMMMRHEIADGHSLRGVVMWGIRWGLSLCAGYLATYLGKFGTANIFVVLFAYMILKAFENLLATWIIHFRGYRAKDILNLPNALRVIGMQMLMIVLDVAVLALCYAVFGTVIAVLLAIPVLAYTFAAMDVTAVEYFRRQVILQRLQPRAQTEAVAVAPIGDAAAVLASLEPQIPQTEPTALQADAVTTDVLPLQEQVQTELPRTEQSHTEAPQEQSTEQSRSAQPDKPKQTKPRTPRKTTGSTATKRKTSDASSKRNTASTTTKRKSPAKATTARASQGKSAQTKTSSSKPRKPRTVSQARQGEVD